MNQLLYYPFTSIQDIKFLKFALLYMENISTIIPENSVSTDKTFYNSDYLTIINDSDLISHYHPTYEDVSITRDKFTDMINNIDEKKFIKFNLEHSFNKSNTNIGIYDGKLDYMLKNTLLELNLACESSSIANVLKVNSVIGRVYMSMLAQTICSNNNIEAITSNYNQFITDMSYIGYNFDKYDATTLKKKIRKSNDIINLYVPVNINIIRTEELISLRNDTYFRQLMSGFRYYVDEYLKLSDKNDLSFEQFIDDKNKDIRQDILKNLFYLGAEYIVKSHMPSFPTVSDIIIDSIPDANLSKALKVGKNITDLTIDLYKNINTEERKKQTQLRHYLCSLSNLKYRTDEQIKKELELNKIITPRAFFANLY